MKKVRHVFINSFRYFCLIVVIALGLIAIVGSGGYEILPFTVEDGIAVGDLNGDGNSDLVLASTYIEGPPPHPGNVYVYLQDSLNPGTFLIPSKYSVGSDPWEIEIADVDKDGMNDIVVANTNSNNVSVLFQDSYRPGIFVKATNYACGKSPYSAVIGDLNGDNMPDIVTTSASDKDRSVSILFQDPDNPRSFPQTINLSTGPGASSVAVGDLNQDGLVDIAVDGSSSVFVLFQNSLLPGEFLPAVSFPTGERSVMVAIHDLNGDGFNDLAVANAGSSYDGTNASVSVLLQDIDLPGSFLPSVNYSTANGARKVIIEDLNGDNSPDLAVATVVYQHQGPGAVSVLLQNTNLPGTFFAASHYYAGFTPDFIAGGDLDGDEKNDIAVGEGPCILFQDPDKPGTFLPLSIVGDFFD
ncbi:MAG: VCBS repeat-containing protein [Ignavibacteriaceae bacterium]|jgi:hypothetical protein|nr:VCBS repeat-containing protein [Ignavibacteriaceae bacterium]